jgi:hypothetical protein
MRKVDLPVQELVAMIGRGELRLPEMQRGYVWKSTQVRDLFDSLYRGYPSGAILVWETGDKQPERNAAIEQAAAPYQSYKLLLDGQQRLTSLSAVINGEPVNVRNRKRPISILFNLEHPDAPEDQPLSDETEEDETDEAEDFDLLAQSTENLAFVVENRRLLEQPNWIRVSDILGSKSETEIIKSAGITSLDDPRYEKYAERIKRVRAIKDYMYSMQVLGRDLSYEEVAEIFVRVNSSGTKLRGSDLALAQITAKWRGCSDLFEDFLAENKDRFELDLGVLVRTLVVFASNQPKFNTVGAIPRNKLIEAWEPTQHGLRFALNFLTENAGIGHPSLLSSQNFVIPIAYLSQYQNEGMTDEEERTLRYWLYAASAKGHYSGSTESWLGTDLIAIRDGEGLAGLLEVLKRQVGRLRIEADDLKGKRLASPLFPLSFLVARERSAKDWHSGLLVSLSHKGVRHRNQYHHVFPKALIRGEYTRGQINEMSNMAFIAGRTNRKIGAKPPEEYLERIIEERGEDMLRAQCIPLDRRLWKVENYLEFLEVRRELLADAMNEFLDGLCTNLVPTIPTERPEAAE